eukprot:15172795-Alexandrium_andersonii.AAC.1
MLDPITCPPPRPPRPCFPAPSQCLSVLGWQRSWLRTCAVDERSNRRIGVRTSAVRLKRARFPPAARVTVRHVRARDLEGEGPEA